MRRVSKPPSNSDARSGLRFGLPSALAVRPGVSMALTLTVGAEYVTSADVAPGCTPDAPNAPRRRNEFSPLTRGKKLSSDRIHERLAFG
jgi:hypothetical protein